MEPNEKLACRLTWNPLLCSHIANIFDRVYGTVFELQTQDYNPICNEGLVTWERYIWRIHWSVELTRTSGHPQTIETDNSTLT